MQLEIQPRQDPVQEKKRCHSLEKHTQLQAGKPDPGKVEAIRTMKQPENKQGAAVIPWPMPVPHKVHTRTGKPK